MTQPHDQTASPAQDELASPEQIDELRSLAGPDEEIPDGMRASEAQQRITELRSAQ